MQKKYVKELILFTDGSLIRRKNKFGDEELKCGYGIYFPNKELRNISRPFNFGRKTNQRAELFAIYVALLQIKANINYEHVTIYTDSEYSIKSITEWIVKWEKNNWKTSKGLAVENTDIIIPINNLLKNQRDKIMFLHVKAHTGKQDPISISNSIVDELARDGALRQKIEKMK